MATLLDKWNSLGWIKYLIIVIVVIVIVSLIVLIVVLVKNKKKSTQPFMESFEVGDSSTKNWSDSKAGINEFVDSWKNVVKKAYTSDVVQQPKQQSFKQNFGQGLVQGVKQEAKKAYNQTVAQVITQVNQAKQELKGVKQQTVQQINQTTQQLQNLTQQLQPRQKETFVSKRSNYGNAARKYHLAAGQNVVRDQSYLYKQHQQPHQKETFVAPRQNYGSVERRYKQAQAYSNNEGYQGSRTKKDFSNQTYLNGMSVKTGVNYKY